MADNPGTQQYSIEKLKTIGLQCASKLPPASTVQAMFLYELQRDCENESLFKSAFFQLGQHDKKLDALEMRSKELENRNHELQCELMEADKTIAAATERLTAQETTISNLKTALETISAKQDSHERAIVAVADQVKDEYNRELISINEQLTAHKQAFVNMTTKAAGLHLRVNEHDKALEKQKDIIRCLTVQKNGDEAGRLVQRIEVNSIHGRPMELLIPKGTALPALRENRKPSEPTAMTRPWPEFKLSDKNLSHSMHAPDGIELRR